MPPTKVCPQCKAAVPVRRKTCKCCDHVFQSKRKAECNLREKAMKHMRAVESDGVKSVRMHKAYEKASEAHEQNSHRQEQNRMCHESHKTVIDSGQHTSTITCTAAPRVWHFSAFHLC